MTRELPDIEQLAQRGYRFALSLTHNAERAEELLQDAWFALLKRDGPWDRGYLFTTIRNRFIDEYRRASTRAAESVDSMEIVQAANEAAASEIENGEAFVANGEMARALERLSPEERGVLYLSGVERCTAQVIADMMQWPRGTVLGVMRRAKSKLREALTNGTGELP